MELKSLCYELLAKYASAKAWISDCYCGKDKDKREAQAIRDHDEIMMYREKIEAAAEGADSYIGLTD